MRRTLEDAIPFFRHWDYWHSRKGRARLANRARNLASLFAQIETELKVSDPLVDYLFTPEGARHWMQDVDSLDAQILADRAAFLNHWAA